MAYEVRAGAAVVAEEKAEVSVPAAFPHPRHLPGLDTLRAMAIVLVILAHAREILGGDFLGPTLKSIFMKGWIGVDLFFVLSGFLIGSQLLQSTQRDGRVAFGKFYFKRSLRILPNYYTVLLLYYIWPAFREKPDIDAPWRYMLFLMNYGRKGEAFSHAWSLCVEEHFYLVFPLMVAIYLWRPKLIRPSVLIAVALGGVIALRYYLWSVDAPFYPAVYRPSHTHLDGLTIGVTLALLKNARPSLWQKLTSRPWLLFTVGLFLVACGIYDGLPKPLSYILSFSFVSFGFGALVASAMAPGFWLAQRRLPGMETLAVLAFSLYLTHKQMIHMATQLLGNYEEQRFATVALSLVLVTVAAVVLHVAVERPCLHWRDRFLAHWSSKDKS